jgi:hypothetical protein
MSRPVVTMLEFAWVSAGGSVELYPDTNATRVSPEKLGVKVTEQLVPKPQLFSMPPVRSSKISIQYGVGPTSMFVVAVAVAEP